MPEKILTTQELTEEMYRTLGSLVCTKENGTLQKTNSHYSVLFEFHDPLENKQW